MVQLGLLWEGFGLPLFFGGNMSCTAPIQAYYSNSKLSKNGKRSIVFGFTADTSVKQILLPCGRCAHCLLERSRQWAMRCVFEAKSHEKNSFLTLTYRDSALTYGFVRPTLVPRHLQLFFKRLRKRFGRGLKYYACGEYGETTQRPHYHVCLFGEDFSQDRMFYSKSNGNDLWTSAALDSVWTHGDCKIGQFSFESAAYVARYCVDKKYGVNAGYYFQHALEPEFSRMSRGGKGGKGIGFAWYDKWKSDVYPHDYVVFDGKKVRPPDYFDKLYAIDFPEQFEYIRDCREEEAKLATTSKRELNAKDVNLQAATSTLRRNDN